MGEDFINLGSTRRSYIFVVLEPVYQANIDLSFRLIARAYFQYTRPDVLAERARLPFLKTKHKALLPLAKAHERTVVSE